MGTTWMSGCTDRIFFLREDDNGQLYGIRWNPDEKTKINNSELINLQKVVAIYL